MTVLQGCRHHLYYQLFGRIVNAAISIFDFPSFEVSVASLDRRRNSKGGGWRRTKLVRRTRNGSSPYFCDSSRPVHPSVADRIIDRWMDGWERGKGLVQRPCPFVPQSPFLSFSFLASLHHPFRRPLLILSLSLILPLKPPPLSSSLPLPFLFAPRFSLFN